MTRFLWNLHRNRWAWHSYAFGLGVLGALIMSRGADSGSILQRAPSLLFFLALQALTEVLYFPLPQGGGVSVGFAILLACIILFGPYLAGLVAGLGLVIAIFLVSGWTGLDRLVFNFGQVALSAFLAGYVYRLIGGDIQASILRNGLAILISGTIYFLANAGLVTMGIGLGTGQSFKSVWTGNVKWTIPSHFALAFLGLLVALVFKTYGIIGSLLLLVPLLFARYSFLLYLNARKASLSVTQALAAALEAKDAYTKGHSDRVAAYALEVAKELGLTDEETQIIKWAAEMHDIGKIGVPESLLNKPGALTDDELEEIRKHAMIGASIVEGIEFLRDVAHIIQYHHEWFDGSNGYPRKLRGKEIPLGARILMVCDSFDAMISDRPYRKGIALDEAVRRLKAGCGTQFDPTIVEALLKVLTMNKAGLVDDI